MRQLLLYHRYTNGLYLGRGAYMVNEYNAMQTL